MRDAAWRLTSIGIVPALMDGTTWPSKQNMIRERKSRAFIACRNLARCITLGLLCTLPAAANSALTDPAFSSGMHHDPASPLAPYAPFLNHDTVLRETDSVQHAGYAWRGAAPTRPDWRGVGRDIGYFLGYQFAAIAVIYVAPESISGWDREQKENYSFDKWRNNVSEPVWDEDRWWINYILHPYWGGTYYIRARERGLDRAQAFWYSALLSTLWEYGAEALAEPVSAQDLVVTPVAGFLVGEYLLAPLQKRIRAKPETLDWSDKAILFMIDPLGVINAETDQLLGVKTTLQWQPVGLHHPALPAAMGGLAAAQAGRPLNTAPAWGLQIRADW